MEVAAQQPDDTLRTGDSTMCIHIGIAYIHALCMCMCMCMCMSCGGACLLHAPERTRFLLIGHLMHSITWNMDMDMDMDWHV